MNIYYCWRWDLPRRCPLRLLSRQDAKKAYTNHKLYTALLGDPVKPSCYLQFSRQGRVFVDFLDEWQRRRMLYAFHMVVWRQFLSMVVLPSYLGDASEPVSEEVYHFDREGHLVIERRLCGPEGFHTVSRVESQTDVSDNWEKIPKFGKYKRMARLDRNLPDLGV